MGPTGSRGYGVVREERRFVFRLDVVCEVVCRPGRRAPDGAVDDLARRGSGVGLGEGRMDQSTEVETTSARARRIGGGWFRYKWCARRRVISSAFFAGELAFGRHRSRKPSPWSAWHEFSRGGPATGRHSTRLAACHRGNASREEEMPGRGLEPLNLAVPDPKSGASANFATPARSF